MVNYKNRFNGGNLIMKILKKILYRGCLKDLVTLIAGFLFIFSPVITKAIADFIIYKVGL